MDFKFYFSKQIEMHPSMQNEDAAKLCYQAAFGAEHLLSDLERAYAYLCAEFDRVDVTHEALFEYISPDVARVNLGAWKREGRAIDTLFEVFKSSAFIDENASEKLDIYLDTAQQVMQDKVPSFNVEDWRVFLKKYKEAGTPPIHHSAHYRECEKPAYRIVKVSELEKVL